VALPGGLDAAEPASRTGALDRIRDAQLGFSGPNTPPPCLADAPDLPDTPAQQGNPPGRDRSRAMYFDYLNVLIFSGVGLVFVFANMIAGALIRPRRKTTQGREVYECGEPTIGEAWIQFDIRYYTVALVYVIFAVEIAFLFPWALVLKESLTDTGVAAGEGIGLFALVEGVTFIAILFIGLAYVWVKGDLDWVLTWQRTSYEPRQPRVRITIPSVEEITASQAPAPAAHAAAAASTGEAA
jgi:NADH-quinone oxidoreductase subunit A